MDVLQGVVLGTGVAMSLPIYWWLFLSPIVRLAKRARHYLAKQILWKRGRRNASQS
jgi:hypothetical protein